MQPTNSSGLIERHLGANFAGSQNDRSVWSHNLDCDLEDTTEIFVELFHELPKLCTTKSGKRRREKMVGCFLQVVCREGSSGSFPE